MEKNARRIFLKKFFGSAIGLGTVISTEAAPEPVKMLDPDGNLVEVDPEVLKVSKKKKVRNLDIIAWSKSILK